MNTYCSYDIRIDKGYCSPWINPPIAEISTRKWAEWSFISRSCSKIGPELKLRCDHRSAQCFVCTCSIFFHVPILLVTAPRAIKEARARKRGRLRSWSQVSQQGSYPCQMQVGRFQKWAPIAGWFMSWKIPWKLMIGGSTPISGTPQIKKWRPKMFPQLGQPKSDVPVSNQGPTKLRFDNFGLDGSKRNEPSGIWRSRNPSTWCDQFCAKAEL